MSSVDEICKSMPDVSVVYFGGQPHYKVRGKIFCGANRAGEPPWVDMKLEDDHADARLATDPRFEKIPYGPGAVRLRLDDISDWDEVRDFIAESYRLVVATLPQPARAKPTPPKSAAKASVKSAARSAAKSVAKPAAKSPAKRGASSSTKRATPAKK